jgi:hypothetical protein
MALDVVSAMPHTFTVPSNDPDTKYTPSGEKATLFTLSL